SVGDERCGHPVAGHLPSEEDVSLRLVVAVFQPDRRSLRGSQVDRERRRREPIEGQEDQRAGSGTILEERIRARRDEKARPHANRGGYRPADPAIEAEVAVLESAIGMDLHGKSRCGLPRRIRIEEMAPRLAFWPARRALDAAEVEKAAAQFQA